MREPSPTKQLLGCHHLNYFVSETGLRALAFYRAEENWRDALAPLSNVAYDIEVTDMMTGETVTYSNPRGEFGSSADTEAFFVP